MTLGKYNVRIQIVAERSREKEIKKFLDKFIQVQIKQIAVELENPKKKWKFLTFSAKI